MICALLYLVDLVLTGIGDELFDELFDCELVNDLLVCFELFDCDFGPFEDSDELWLEVLLFME